MRFWEFLIEKTGNFDSIKHGTWDIKFTTVPLKKDGKYHAAGYHPKVAKSFFGNGESPDEAIQQVKDQIATVRSDINATEIKRTTLDFNSNFTSEILEGYLPTAVRLLEIGGKPYLDVVTPEWFDQFHPSELKAEGFKPLLDRKWGKSTLYMAMFTPPQIEKVGLEFNGRYVMHEEQTDDEMYRRFSLTLDSITQGPQDRYAMGVPGFTVATWIKGENQEV